MSAVAQALEPLNDDERIRVLRWAGARYQVTVTTPDDVSDTVGSGGPDEVVDAADPTADIAFDDFADFYEAAQPRSNEDRALAAGYWVQVIEGNANFQG